MFWARVNSEEFELDKNEIERIIRVSVLKAVKDQTQRKFVPGAVSNRHVHLSKNDIEALFGTGYKLTVAKALSQPEQYAANETVSLVGAKGRIDKIRVLGPARPDTQVEISMTDSFKLGIKPVIRMSGDVAGSPGGVLETAQGRVELKQGVIVSERHLHISPQQAADYGLADGQKVKLRTQTTRTVVFEDVVVRSGAGHELEVHLDMDEANSAGLKNGDLLEIV